ncbi:neuroblast differentiation-associated protein AHNAK [Kryptolebias marmoratus]|uniref:Neuroblast differentiation-associated protein AHNAK-like n=1 Tax=Kryptolebias marmoratus TaxID=37003 RepID=A0A3Q3FXY6_KRYMA|nr:neuroblast differentiation-associated protein AHNAK [Kryptolebias marmoratus]
MPTHRRGRSLSEALTLEQSEEGGLVISNVNSSSQRQDLKEGDEILGATINFDHLSKDEVLNVLKLIEPYDDKIQVLTRKKMSKSLENLDQCARTPKAMLNDSYNKLYNAKIKRFVKKDLSGAVAGSGNWDGTVPASSIVSLKHDMGLPRLGVDFGLLKSKTVNQDANVDSNSNVKELMDGRNLNLPPMGLGTLSNSLGPRLNLDARNPQLVAPDCHLSGTLPDDQNVRILSGKHLPDTERTSYDLTLANHDRIPEMGLDRKGSDITIPKTGIDVSGESFTGPVSNVSVPKVNIEGINPEFKMPKFKLPDLANSELSKKSPKSKVKIPDVEIPGAPSGAHLNVDTPSGSLTLPRPGVKGRHEDEVDLSLKRPQFKGGISASDENLFKANIKGTDLTTDTPSFNFEGRAGKYKAPKFTMPKFDLPNIQVPDFSGDLDLPDGDLAVPSTNLGISTSSKRLQMASDLSLKTPKIKGEINTPDLDFPNIKMKNPKLDVNTPDVNIGSPKAKLKLPKMKMPKFSLPSMKGPEIDGNINAPDIDAPNVKFKGPKADLDMDFPGLSGKFKKPNLNLPDLGFSDPDLDGPNLDLKTPDLDMSAPNLRGGINAPDVNMPKVDLKSSKPDLNTPKVNLDMPSGKLKMPELQAPDWDINAPPGKLKMPKMNLSGTLPKGPNLGLNTDLKAPDLSLKAPKIKGEMNTPDLDFPNIKMRNPKLDVNTPDVNIGSPKAKLKLPKMKMPKFSLPSMKGPEIDGNINAPDIDAPNVKFKGPKADLDMDFPGLSGKFKKPNLNLPDLGFSDPDLDGPNLDLKTPDLDMSAPNLRGGINAPDVNMPKVDLKSSKPDLNTPKVNLDMPSGKLKMPELQAPDWDINAPPGKLKMPKMNLSGTLPKGPNLGLNTDLKAPDLSLKAPKIKGEMNTPDLDFPNIRMKNPKLDVNSPDVHIGSPKTKFKMPNVGFSHPKLDGPDFDFSSPNLNATLPKGSNLKLSSDLNNPDLNLKFPKSKGRLDSPNLTLPNMNLKSSKTGLEVPDADFSTPSGKMKMPHMKIPEVGFSDPVIDSPNPRLNSPNLNAKLPKGANLKIDSDLNSPDLNVTAPKTKGGLTFPKLGTPDINLKAPELDMKTSDASIHITNMHVNSPKVSGPRLRAPDVSLPVLDLPHARVNAPRLDLSGNHPDLGVNCSIAQPKMNFTGPQMKGDLKGPNVSSPNIDFNMPKVAKRSPQLHLRSPDLNIDDPSVKFKVPSSKIHRSDMASMSIKKPDLDIDENVRLHCTNKTSSGTKVRTSYPVVDDALHQYINFNRSDLNIDDFTEKDHVLRARGSKLDLQAPFMYEEGMPSSGVIVDMWDSRNAQGMPIGGKESISYSPNLSQHLQRKVPESSDGYYVTVFPKQSQNQKMVNRKFNTQGRLDFHSDDLDLDVPNKNDLKGSTFFFSNLV